MRFLGEILMYYVIQVRTGKEQKTIDAIKRQIGDRPGFDVFAPYRKVIKKFKGVEKEVVVRCFPGYLFVETDKPYDFFVELYWTPEFTKMLGREGHTENFLPLNEDEARMIDILYSNDSGRTTEISDIEVHEGEIIRVLDGPLEGLLGSIVSVNLHKKIVVVEFSMCGRMVTAQLGINIITNKIRK